MKKQKISFIDFINEEQEWLSLSPAQRILETTKLWKLYLSLGGNLDPESNSQSPFYFSEIQSKKTQRDKERNLKH